MNDSFLIPNWQTGSFPKEHLRVVALLLHGKILGSKAKESALLFE
jgi:hypothetical protein